MALETQPTMTGALLDGLQSLRANWGWFLALGIALIVLGTLAIGAAFIATLAVAVTFGILLLIGGGVQIASAFWARRWSGFFLQLLVGILYVVVGALMVEHPIGAAAGLTLMLAAYFLAAGLLRIVVALTERFHNWGWVLLNGVITLVLGVLIWRQWPESSLWVLGLFVGIDMIFSGWSWVMLALALRSLPRQAA
jgi:uncharacterized membrane protein HdeD (DUF308 family)